MGFLRNLFHRNREEDEIIEELNEETSFTDSGSRPYLSAVDIHDDEKRERYVRYFLEQMAEADKELELLGYEYSLVTAYLTDMEEIEALPAEVLTELAETGRRITRLEQERKELKGQKSRMTEAEYQKMERLEDEMPEASKKLREAEEYQVLIKQDMKRLEKDKQAYQIRREELEAGLGNLKGVFFIVFGALVICMVILVVLQLVFDINARFGYLVLALMAALSMALSIVRHNMMTGELEKADNAHNRLIQLQNTVKIRLVNNTNLLEYYKMKLQVESADALDYLWQQYGLEKEDRAKIEKAKSDLEYYYNLLVRTLRRYRIQDPNVWIHQAEALYDSKEMVEIRHGLIIRRQKLRSQMEYNSDIATTAQNEIKELVSLYPEYTKKILDIVAEYERKTV